ncbi:TetR/AcrR family transcriptional regulator [Streptomyces scabiei]|uniref:TetR/AcrR family transcriptional regulator n=1 Tax=Streptomyces scabiei TaxID=1930 RepID=UPI001B31511A|nr:MULTISPECIES: TetR/AcrR family transcriptional regulator [Streptomyces]MBP5862344.1 TetR/AcrR family transcriptional regulator [Streptomyces sp. LBUM 1484]MBP5885029.1 TetR/AcrR family transcriptional regulator [Streptomyces sp. LBUM 1487]MBP5900998.1 TetR/AcrR family transcriptional regulator [Streptomyces sp. LBUM 1488]MDW8474517.1 TetR/AcrR family transcriptional regulator [Streptomyces scabiei]MDX2568212.1 TetR/AcrR family transcriptional regulator [Streptomyces scabiei]
MKSQVKRVPNVRGEGERLRQEILDAATRILEETGREDALSLRGVAREVGISAPSVYRHFKDKADLVSTVLDATYRALAVAMREAGESAAAAGADPWARARATVTAYRRFAIDKPRRYRLMFSLEYEPQHHPSADHPIGTVLQAWTDTADAYLTEAAPDRRAEAQDLGIHLWTALHGQLVLWRTLPSPVAGSEDVLIELEGSLLRRLLPAPEAPSPTE